MVVVAYGYEFVIHNSKTNPRFNVLLRSGENEERSRYLSILSFFFSMNDFYDIFNKLNVVSSYFDSNLKLKIQLWL